ncbi:Golgi GRIP domain protein Grp2 [Schizosaccharomyces osmophilus]|uniref:Golgi GRIP domain protein Grp2 n=1 Tax=Schizosaccharomyces osmophilus TaxID=2545709 RepID=A0AAE9WDP0_9SCHI|nr:Golgi GRIP domain protein Grp2 [Schizosaccharomyces osmophilus]WBW73978.1 Golgi GRIP domain protein Grp2 [Schizosaccharomyces osmophilus]
MATSLAVNNDLERENHEKDLKENFTVSTPPSVSSSSKKKKKNKKKKKTVTTEANGEHPENGASADQKKENDSLVSELQLRNRDLVGETDALRSALEETQRNNVEADELKGLMSREMDNLKKEVKDLKDVDDVNSDEKSRIQEENQNLQDMLRNVGNELVDSRDEIKELKQKMKDLERKDETPVQISEVKSNEITPNVHFNANEANISNGLSKDVIDKEYVRNVLIQFLENQEHREQILPILAIALDLDEIHQQILLKCIN